MEGPKVTKGDVLWGKAYMDRMRDMPFYIQGRKIVLEMIDNNVSIEQVLDFTGFTDHEFARMGHTPSNGTTTSTPRFVPTKPQLNSAPTAFCQKFKQKAVFLCRFPPPHPLLSM